MVKYHIPLNEKLTNEGWDVLKEPLRVCDTLP